MEIPFTKMHGLENSYIYVDLFQFQIEDKWLPLIAQQVSNVNTGIGSDGLIVIHPSEKADLGMRIFNKDGSEGKNCGNGLRCAAKYAYEKGIVDSVSFRIETQSNIVEVEVMDRQKIVIDMGIPLLRRVDVPMMGNDDPTVIAEPFVIIGETLSVTALSMGNPHAIFFVEETKKVALHELGPVIEQDERFPDGVNVEFVDIISGNELNMHVWERGSGPTHACGTGACASVVAAILNKRVKKNEEVIVHLQGGDLIVKWDHTDHVWMTGSAEIIATGTFNFQCEM